MEILIKETKVKNVITKSNLPVCDYSVNPYVGCTHACKYCYASFMKRFTGHTEPWETFLDVKYWEALNDRLSTFAQKQLLLSEMSKATSVDAIL